MLGVLSTMGPYRHLAVRYVLSAVLSSYEIFQGVEKTLFNIFNRIIFLYLSAIKDQGMLPLINSSVIDRVKLRGVRNKNVQEEIETIGKKL